MITSLFDLNFLPRSFISSFSSPPSLSPTRFSIYIALSLPRSVRNVAAVIVIIGYLWFTWKSPSLIHYKITFVYYMYIAVDTIWYPLTTWKIVSCVVIFCLFISIVPLTAVEKIVFEN